MPQFQLNVHSSSPGDNNYFAVATEVFLFDDTDYESMYAALALARAVAVPDCRMRVYRPLPAPHTALCRHIVGQVTTRSSLSAREVA